eukprot:gene16161-22322_t
MCTKAISPGACADASNALVNFAFNRNDPREAPFQLCVSPMDVSGSNSFSFKSCWNYNCIDPK